MGHANRVAHNIKSANHTDTTQLDAFNANNVKHMRRAVAYAGGRYFYPSYTIVIYLPPKRKLEMQ